MAHKPNAIRQYEDFARSAKSPDALQSVLPLITELPRYAHFWQYIVFHKGDLAGSFQNKFQIDYPFFELVNPGASVFRLSIQAGRFKDRKESGIIAILPGSRENIHRVFTVGYSDFWKNAVRRLIHKAYPVAMPVFFKQNEMEDALVALENALGENYRVRIAEVTMRGERYGGTHGRRKYYDTNRLWTELSISDAFTHAMEQGSWFTGIKYSIQHLNKRSQKYHSISTGRIYKGGDLYYDYDHGLINNNCVSVLEGYAAERLNFLQGRGIRERNYHAGKPIEILYQREIFSDVHEIRRFGDVIKNYPQSTKSIHHANPYYHASVADFLEGSSFELWVLSSQRILISPQAKSSEKALERLISHIFTEFEEGDISEYSG